MSFTYNFKLKLCLWWVSFIALGLPTGMTTTRTIQGHDIVGRVSDAGKNAIQGVVVEVIGANSTKVVSGKNGEYGIRVSSPKDKIRFLHIGYETKEIVAGSKKVLNVTLLAKKTVLNEVVDLNYFRSLKRHTSGSLDFVDMKSIQKAPVIRFEDALAGRLAGLQVSSSHGQPGDPMNFVVRGNGSVTKSSPLFVIDGIAVDNLNNLALNQDDIKNISVLKDASLLALYGSRGANGVVLIETVKGYAGKATINFNSFYGFQNSTNMIEMMSPYEFVRYQLELNPTEAKKLYTTADLDPSDPEYNANGRKLADYKGIPGIDWQDEITQVAPVQRYSLSMVGGDANTKFMLSTSLADQEGVLLNSGATRFQGRVSLDQRLSQNLKGGLGLNYGDNSRVGQAINFEDAVNLSAFSMARTWGARPISGEPNVDLLGSFLDPQYASAPLIKYNPLLTLENEEKKNKNSNLVSYAFLEYDITKHLKARAHGSIVLDKTKGTSFYNSFTPAGTGVNGVNGNFYYSKSNYASSDITLTYDNLFQNLHGVNVLAGFSYNKYLKEMYGITSVNLPNEGVGVYGLDEGVPIDPISKKWKDKFKSYFIKGEYVHNLKYYLTAVLRADEAGGNRELGYSPALALAWNMKQESFLRESTIVSHAKLRGSMGRSGLRFGMESSPIGSAVHYNVKWEATDQIDLGYDLGLWNDRLLLNLDVYQRKTASNSVYFLRSRVENKGLDIVLNTDIIQRKNFAWKSSLKLSWNENKLLQLNDVLPLAYSYSSLSTSTPMYILQTGHTLGSFFGYQFDGIYQIDDFDLNSGVYTLKADLSDNGSVRGMIQPGDIKYKDINGDKTVDLEDRVVLGSSAPNHFGGFSNDFIYKSFDFNVYFQWSAGNKVFNANRLIFEGDILQQMGMNQYASYSERWTPENRSNTLYRVGGQGPDGIISDRTLEDGSYLRLKTLALAYTLPKNSLKSIYVKNLRLFASVQNLFTFTKYTGLDPEVSVRHSVLTQGFDYSAYPQARTIAFGLNASF